MLAGEVYIGMESLVEVSRTSTLSPWGHGEENHGVTKFEPYLQDRAGGVWKPITTARPEAKIVIALALLLTSFDIVRHQDWSNLQPGVETET